LERIISEYHLNLALEGVVLVTKALRFIVLAGHTLAVDVLLKVGALGALVQAGIDPLQRANKEPLFVAAPDPVTVIDV
jgi:phosphate starvation-inducible membrane PsiE